MPDGPSSKSLPKPLPKGDYDFRCKERTLVQAAANGHSRVWPAATGTCDGKWVSMQRDGEQIFECNAAYASANFICRVRHDAEGA